MARINLRLACSLLAVGAVAVLALWPGTRPLIERQLWILSGTYEKRTDPDPNRFGGSIDDVQVLNVLTGYERIPVDSRAVELAKLAATRKDVNLWAHVIRQTTMAPVPLTEPEKISDLDRVRTESLAKIQLTAATEGKKSEPNNVYFDLAEAAALAKLRRWDDMATVLIQAGRKTQYDDHILDEFRRRVKFLYERLHPVLPSDLGAEWSNILFPHLSNFRSVTQLLGRIEDPKRRLAAGLGLARVGKVLFATDGEIITRLVGVALIKRSAYWVVGQEPGDKDNDLKPVLGKIVAQANKLGAKDIAAGWQEFSSWKRPDLGSEYPEYTPDPNHFEAIRGVHGLYLLCVVAVLGAVIWLASNLDPSTSNIVNLGLILLMLELPVILSTERAALSFGILASGNAFFVAFLLVRLPGKTRLGVAVLVAALLLALLTCGLSGHPELLAGVAGLWGIPLAYSQWIRATAPKWAGVILATAFFGFGLFMLLNGASSSAAQFGHHLGETLITILAMGAYWIPWLVALIMAITKVNLPDALKVTAKPLPFLALAASAFFVWGTREGMHQQKLWQALADQELPPKYRQAMDEAKKAVPEDTGFSLTIKDPRSPF